jgi:dienelactone hydrolase
MSTSTSTITTLRASFPFEGAAIPVYVARPVAPPRVTVLMLGAIWSVTPHIEDLCRSLAQAGYGAVAPCLFRGTGIGPRTRAGVATVVGQGTVSFLKMRANDVVSCAPGAPPETRYLNVHVIHVGSSFDLAAWSGDPNPPVRVRVHGGGLEWVA